MGAAGPALSIAAVGLSAAGDISKGFGQKAADEYQAARLDRAAQYGELQASQVGAQLTEKLNVTLGNIDTISAAAHLDPTSPSTAAYRDYQEYQGTRAKEITVDSLLSDARQKESDAAYLREAGSFALGTSFLSAGGDILKGLSPLAGAKSPAG